MNLSTEYIILFVGIYILTYLFVYLIISFFVERAENAIIEIFLAKVSKIPAIIEVMRPYVVDEKAFDLMTTLHSEVMIYRYDTIYDLLEHNANIHNQFLFLMQLSVRIPELQKHEYFLYVRDFIIRYERDMRGKFFAFNSAVKIWNWFIFLKNVTIIGLFLPGRKRDVLV